MLPSITWTAQGIRGKVDCWDISSQKGLRDLDYTNFHDRISINMITGIQIVTIDITGNKSDHLAQPYVLMKYYHYSDNHLFNCSWGGFDDNIATSNLFQKATLVTRRVHPRKRRKRTDRWGNLCKFWDLNLNEEGNIENSITAWVHFSSAQNLFQIVCSCWITSSSHVFTRATCLIPEIMKPLWLVLLLSSMCF